MVSDVDHLNVKEKAVVLLSGGLDSTVALAKAMEDYQVLMAVTVAYGQRAVKKELHATAHMAAFYQITHRIIHLPWMEELLPVAMKATLDNQLPEDTPKEDPMAVKTVWVPNRNGVLLNIAASLAEAHQATVVTFGANVDEAADFPDNTQAYRDKITECFQYSTLNQVHVETPVGDLTKAQIVEEGIRLKAPMHLIWSCYESGDIHCGRCASCVRLKTAVQNTSLSLAFSS